MPLCNFLSTSAHEKMRGQKLLYIFSKLSYSVQNDNASANITVSKPLDFLNTCYPILFHVPKVTVPILFRTLSTNFGTVFRYNKHP